MRVRLEYTIGIENIEKGARWEGDMYGRLGEPLC